MKKLFIIFFLAVLAVSSCKKDVTPGTSPTTAELARDYLYLAMNDIYLWYKLMPVVVKNDYSDPYKLLEAMRYKPTDRWSYVQTYAEYTAQSNGSFVGHGISLGLDPFNNVRIVQIYKNSNMYALGVRRGWIVKKLNNTDLAPIFIAGDNAAYTQLIGPAVDGRSNTFLFQTPLGKDSTITTTKSAFTLNTVIVADTLHLQSGAIVGHLVFDQFIPPSTAELATAFGYFNQCNITDLIVDLRYNGGGDLDVTINMASSIAGAARVNSPFLKLTHNDKNTSYNATYNFTAATQYLNLTRLIVITTRGTASASEDLINGLKPYLAGGIICFGDTTNGKPVGMYGVNYETSYMFWPIAYSLVNKLNQGEFYQGFYPLKYVPDDFTHDWSDRNESCLKEAIYYLEHGTASPKGAYIYQPSIQFSEKPDRMNNAFFIKK